MAQTQTLLNLSRLGQAALKPVSRMSSAAEQERLSKRVEFLRQVSPFAGLQEADLLALAQDFHPKKYGRNDLIFRQGDSGRSVYVVVEGKVRIFRVSPAGHETSLIIFMARDVFGEFAALDDRPRSATAHAIQPCTLLEMAQEKLVQHLRAMPDLSLAMTRLLVSKIRWTAAYAETIAQYDAAGRLLHILLLYNEQFGEVIEPGRRYVLDLALNQADLASLVGARREWVNRILRDWRQRGLLEYQAGRIIILDLPRVEAERDSRIEANVGEW